MSSSESEINIKEFGDCYVELSVQIEYIPSAFKQNTTQSFLEPPSPTSQERKKAYHYQKLLKEYESAALQGAQTDSKKT